MTSDRGARGERGAAPLGAPATAPQPSPAPAAAPVPASVAAPAPASVAVLADDLIWSSRLVEAVRGAGATPVRALRPADLERAIEAGAGFAIIDLSGNRYDGVAAVASASATGARVRALAHHGDTELRKAALAAGAERVLAYSKLFQDGPAVVRAWVEGDRGDRATDDADAPGDGPG